MLRPVTRLLLLAVLLLPAPAMAAALYAFGDSLSDTGNAFLATGTPPAPYYDGRFSNGPVWTDTVAAAIGAGAATPALAGGTIYATGGATALGPVGGNSLVTQLGAYLTSPTRFPAPGGALFTLWAGSNDVLNSLASNPGNTLAIAQQAAQVVLGVAQTLVTAGGARDLLLVTLPDLGVVPRLVGTPLAGLATLASERFNAVLAAGLASSATLAAANVHVLDVFSLIDAAVADPARFGFTNVTQACFDAAAIPPVCGATQAQQNAYLFWDSIHPTSAAHLLIAQAALAAIPEPATMALFAFGLVGLGMAVRGRAGPSRLG